MDETNIYDGHPTPPLEGTSHDGVSLGLLEGIIAAGSILNDRDWTHPEVMKAVEELRGLPFMGRLIHKVLEASPIKKAKEAETSSGSIIPNWMLSANLRAAEKLIEEAPHAHDCKLGRPDKRKTGTVDFPCTCWKSRALKPLLVPEAVSEKKAG